MQGRPAAAAPQPAHLLLRWQSLGPWGEGIPRVRLGTNRAYHALGRPCSASILQARSLGCCSDPDTLVTVEGFLVVGRSSVCLPRLRQRQRAGPRSESGVRQPWAASSWQGLAGVVGWLGGGDGT